MRSLDYFDRVGPTIRRIKPHSRSPRSECLRSGADTRGCEYKKDAGLRKVSRAPPADTQSTTQSSSRHSPFVSVTAPSRTNPSTAKLAFTLRIRRHVPAYSPTPHPQASAYSPPDNGVPTALRDMRYRSLSTRSLPAYPRPCGVHTPSTFPSDIRPQAYHTLPEPVRLAVAKRQEAPLATRRL